MGSHERNSGNWRTTLRPRLIINSEDNSIDLARIQKSLLNAYVKYIFDKM